LTSIIVREPLLCVIGHNVNDASSSFLALFRFIEL